MRGAGSCVGSGAKRGVIWLTYGAPGGPSPWAFGVAACPRPCARPRVPGYVRARPREGQRLCRQPPCASPVLAGAPGQPCRGLESESRRRGRGGACDPTVKPTLRRGRLRPRSWWGGSASPPPEAFSCGRRARQ